MTVVDAYVQVGRRCSLKNERVGALQASVQSTTRIGGAREPRMCKFKQSTR